MDCGIDWVEKGFGFSRTAELKLQNHRKIQSSDKTNAR